MSLRRPEAGAPRFALVIGAPGAGKTTWRRCHRRELPPNFYDADSLADGLGGYDDPVLQRAARTIIGEHIDIRFARGEPFGLATTYSDPEHKRLARSARARGYETLAIFLGTAEPSINVRRVRVNARNGGGPDVPARLVARQWLAAQYNLVSTVSLFDRIRLIDVTTDRILTLADCPRSELQPLQAPRWAARLSAGLLRGRLPRASQLSR